MQDVDGLIERLRELESHQEDEIEAVKAALLSLALGPNGREVCSHIERAMRGELLEVRWELEEVLEEALPEKPAPAKPQPEPAEEEAPAGGDDELVLVYDDPRGLLLHRTPQGDRWFATQVDPATGQPATFELPLDQVEAVKQQLAGSPYWVLGASA